MKKIIIAIFIFLPAVFIYSQVPQAFKYQAIARDEAGNILSNWKINLRISIVKDNQDGKIIYTETHQVTSTIYGLINIVIGEGMVEKGDFENIDWGTSSYYIKMEMDTRGGTDFREMGSSQLYAVPYALYAENAGNIVNMQKQEPSLNQKNPQKNVKTGEDKRNGTPNTKFSSDTSSYLNVNVGNVGVGTTDPQEKLEVNGSIKANHAIIVDAIGNQWEMFVDTTGMLYFIDKYLACGDSLYDYRDGQYYQTVQIGAQCWMAENLNVGVKINSATGGTEQTDNGIIEKYCHNNDISRCANYGGLYEWNEMMQYVSTEGAQGICPPDWHIPANLEWSALITYLGGLSVAGGKMKAIGTTGDSGLWTPPNTGATNESGFTGLPGGVRYYGSGNSFGQLNNRGNFWSSSEASFDTTVARGRFLVYDSESASEFIGNKLLGYSVRCLKNVD
jgi:uncharacterized protein (TIGR02145 family)